MKINDTHIHNIVITNFKRSFFFSSDAGVYFQIWRDYFEFKIKIFQLTLFLMPILDDRNFRNRLSIIHFDKNSSTWLSNEILLTLIILQSFNLFLLPFFPPARASPSRLAVLHCSLPTALDRVVEHKKVINV